ncbi:glycosyltransferase [Patescibacteria group bacterium]|nr:glycosyltransferase [Patescibacteria group bacterium]
MKFVESVGKDKNLSKKVSLHIFGDGELKDKIPSLPFVTYHGHLPKEQVIPIWKTCHFTIMPSQFLETFGLTALDSISLGVPVIAYPKGALLQFLTPATSLSS